MRSVGSYLPPSSPLRPTRRARAIERPGGAGPYELAADMPADADILAAIAAISGGNVAFVLGEGALPPALPPIVPGAAQVVPPIPAPDAVANHLGSGAVYAIEKDIGEKLSIAALAKNFKTRNFFGCDDDGNLKMNCTQKDLEAWLERIMMLVRPYLPVCYPAGSFMDFMLDPYYEPKATMGRSYYPDLTETWTAYTVDQQTIDRFQNRKNIILRHIADICLAFSEPTYWRPLARNVADQSDGQSMIDAWMKHFLDESVIGLTARATALRKIRIIGAEDPSLKLKDLVEGWARLLTTARGHDQYPISWLSETVSMMVQFNAHYSIWRQSGGLTKLLESSSASEIPMFITTVWADNHTEWERAEKKAGKSAAARERGSGRDGGGRTARQGAGAAGASGSKDMSKIKCFNCDQLGHYASNCTKPDKRKGRSHSSERKRNETIKEKKSRTSSSSWTRAPCKFKGCTGDRKTHAASDCPDKLANDKKARAGSRVSDKDKKRKRDDADSQSDSDDDVAEEKRRARISFRRKNGRVMTAAEKKKKRVRIVERNNTYHSDSGSES